MKEILNFIEKYMENKELLQINEIITDIEIGEENFINFDYKTFYCYGDIRFDTTTINKTKISFLYIDNIGINDNYGELEYDESTILKEIEDYLNNKILRIIIENKTI